MDTKNIIEKLYLWKSLQI